METSKVESFATIAIWFQIFEGVLAKPMNYYCVRLSQSFDITMANIETTLKQRCYTVVSTFSNVGFCFIFNVGSTTHFDPTLKCWPGTHTRTF